MSSLIGNFAYHTYLHHHHRQLMIAEIYRRHRCYCCFWRMRQVFGAESWAFRLRQCHRIPRILVSTLFWLLARVTKNRRAYHCLNSCPLHFQRCCPSTHLVHSADKSFVDTIGKVYSYFFWLALVTFDSLQFLANFESKFSILCYLGKRNLLENYYRL